ncbi:hypothetical protein ES288_A02G178700v1 [Gossypium darwinii]|uniref:Uncharacterized protein n=1 Tax=Gossypium darwinii TaxID=34276 RepID=A0A5D2HH90_GOSDA|nr:hypothetical protein ES288_A02G178700v1 [Gossypium darwinii]
MLRRMNFYALSSKPLLKAKLSANKEREKKEFFVPLPNSITTTEKSLRRELKGIQGMAGVGGGGVRRYGTVVVEVWGCCSGGMGFGISGSKLAYYSCPSLLIFV